MASHKSKVLFTKAIIAFAVVIYILSFFFANSTGFAVIGTSVQILDDSSNNSPTPINFGGSPSGSNIQSKSFFSGFCENQVILDQNKQVAIDITTTPLFCLGLQNTIFSNPILFSGMQAKNVESITQLDVVSYPSQALQTFFLKFNQTQAITVDAGTQIYAKQTTLQDVVLTQSGTSFFKQSTMSPGDAILVFSLNKTTVEQPPQTLDTLLSAIETAKNNVSASNFSGAITDNTSLSYLLQNIQVVELDQNDVIINKSQIPLQALLTYNFNNNTRRIAIHWQDESTPWLVFSRTATSLEQLSQASPNYTLQQYSKSFLLENQNSNIVPTQLEMFRTMLLGVVSIGLLSLHSLALGKPSGL